MKVKKVDAYDWLIGTEEGISWKSWAVASTKEIIHYKLLLKLLLLIWVSSLSYGQWRHVFEKGYLPYIFTIDAHKQVPGEDSQSAYGCQKALGFIGQICLRNTYQNRRCGQKIVNDPKIIISSCGVVHPEPQLRTDWSRCS